MLSVQNLNTTINCVSISTTTSQISWFALLIIYLLSLTQQCWFAIFKNKEHFANLCVSLFLWLKQCNFSFFALLNFILMIHSTFLLNHVFLCYEIFCTDFGELWRNFETFPIFPWLIILYTTSSSVWLFSEVKLAQPVFWTESQNSWLSYGQLISLAMSRLVLPWFSTFFDNRPVFPRRQSMTTFSVFAEPESKFK